MYECRGSPISPMLYMLYNTDLLEIPENKSGVLSLGFINDIVYGAVMSTGRAKPGTDWWPTGISWLSTRAGLTL